jgi:hypothetical protein
MPKRKGTDIIKVNLRLREALRQRLEREAKRNDTSLNSEMARRLEGSVNAEEHLADLVGGEKNLQLFRVLGPAIALIEGETGKRWEEDVRTWVRVSRSIAAILQGFQHLDVGPSELSTRDALNQLTGDLSAVGTIAAAPMAGPLVKRVLQGDPEEPAQADPTDATAEKQ